MCLLIGTSLFLIVMNFSELRQNYPVYILNKTDMLAIQGKVINAGSPYFHQPSQSGMPLPLTTPQSRVVDVTIDIQGNRQTFTIPESSSVTCAQVSGKELIIATERQGIVREVEVMKAQSEEVIASVDKHKSIIESCEKILSEYNPAFAEKQQQDLRITGLENKVESMSKMLSDFINEFKK